MTEIYERLGVFQTKFRDYLVGRLIEAGIDPNSNDDANRPNETHQLELSDFKWLVQRNRDVFRSDFGAKVNNLPTWLDDLREVRNKVAHYTELTKEDEDLAAILIKKISEFAKFEIESAPPKSVSNRPNTRQREDRLRIDDPILDSVLRDFPRLTVERKQNEYRVYLDDGSGRGSLWIGPQKSGYSVVTTGVAHRLDSDIERLTGVLGKEMSDRAHKQWISVSRSVLSKLFGLYSQI